MAAKLHTIILNKDEDVTAGIPYGQNVEGRDYCRRRRLHL